MSDLNKFTWSRVSKLPGFRLAAMNDPVGRRGIWFRQSVTAEGDQLEVRAGREGADQSVTLTAGHVVDGASLAALRGALEIGAWMVGESGIDDSEDAPSHLNPSRAEAPKLSITEVSVIQRLVQSELAAVNIRMTLRAAINDATGLDQMQDQRISEILIGIESKLALIDKEPVNWPALFAKLA